MTRAKVNAQLKRGHKTGGKQSGKKQKRKCASALADEAGDRGVKALAAKRKRQEEAVIEADELDDAEEEGDQDEGEEEEEEGDGEDSGEMEEQESQEAETQVQPQKTRKPRTKVLIVSLPCYTHLFPDVIRESARSARRISKWVVSGIL